MGPARGDAGMALTSSSEQTDPKGFAWQMLKNVQDVEPGSTPFPLLLRSQEALQQHVPPEDFGARFLSLR